MLRKFKKHLNWRPMNVLFKVVQKYLAKSVFLDISQKTIAPISQQNNVVQVLTKS